MYVVVTIRSQCDSLSVAKSLLVQHSNLKMGNAIIVTASAIVVAETLASFTRSGQYAIDEPVSKRSISARYLASPGFFFTAAKERELIKKCEQKLESVPPGVYRYKFVFYWLGKPRVFTYDLKYGKDCNKSLNLRIAFQEWKSCFTPMRQAKMDEVAFDGRYRNPPSKQLVACYDKDGTLLERAAVDPQYATNVTVAKWVFHSKD